MCWKIERSVESDAACVVLRKDVYERVEAMDYSPWTKEEMDLLAAETADLLAGDGLDEPEDVRAGAPWDE